LIAGGGGLGTEYVWIAEAMNAAGRESAGWRPWQLLGYTDDAPEKRGQMVGGYLVHGDVEQAAAKFQGQEIYFAAAIGDNAARQSVVRRADAFRWRPAALIHPSVIMAPDATVGGGSYIAPGCVVCPRAQVGEHVIINVHVSVGHDSILEDYSQVCPGARISGGCHLGKLAFVGSNGSLTPGIKVGEGAVVGANSHAVRNVPRGATVIGCPARSFGTGEQRHG